MARKRADAAVKERLTRERIVDCAIALAGAEGLEAVTIRRLAQDQGVTPMALYWHFKDKDRLLDGIAEKVLSDVTLPAGSGGPWHEQLRHLLSELLTVLRAHPAVADLVKTRFLLSEPGLQLAERALGLLRGAGFTPEQSAQLSGHALQTIVALVTQEPGLMVGEDPAAREDHIRLKRASLQALSPDRFPNMVASADAFTDCGNEPAYFELGLDLFIEGVRGVQPGQSDQR
ncbi:TetR/AcrR family transcriptional regulator [Cryptosporangium arvum]|uniref:Transcriptional regulator n=1 Tax=Cryptosporangium arvum DSM 44712 TaxID=927661 RepID=A0A010ZRL4_9ACTN|nr:TetR/AcrR family transcriptional regulator C-terminal domain-containing protein [Cryptosporangium arvum]EXG81249.1 transcriptional regulator [Cryptosporangium arvum DSM 44712]